MVPGTRGTTAAPTSYAYEGYTNHKNKNWESSLREQVEQDKSGTTVDAKGKNADAKHAREVMVCVMHTCASNSPVFNIQIPRLPARTAYEYVVRAIPGTSYDVLYVFGNSCPLSVSQRQAAHSTI